MMTGAKGPPGRPPAGRGGYSLVEIAIVLAVVGVVAGGSVLPLGTQLRQKPFDQADQLMGDSIDAVVSYAATHRTPGVRLIHALQQNRGVYRIADIPSGRPYLPCPDIDFDGLEDRHETSIPLPTGSDEIPYYGGPTADFLVRPGANLTASHSLQRSIVADRELALGFCERQHGHLPWRTLGLPPYDPWGSSMIYIVDWEFSSAVFGFDQDTRSGLYNRYANFGNLAALSKSSREDEILTPLIVCTPEIVDVNDCLADDSLAYDSIGVQQDDGTPLAYTTLPASDSYFHYYNLNFLYNPAVQHVVDGLPFAIISPGANQFRGLYINSADPANYEICKEGPDASALDAEKLNAAYGHCSTGSLLRSFYTDNLTQTEILGAAHPFVPANAKTFTAIYAKERWPRDTDNVGASSYFDVNLAGEIGYFDDIVGWLTRRELGQQMRQLELFPMEQTFTGTYNGL